MKRILFFILIILILCGCNYIDNNYITIEGDIIITSEIEDSSEVYYEDNINNEDIVIKEIETEEVEEIINTHIIDNIECILQNPELPTGCEVISLCIVLNYLGLDVDKCDLSDNYLDKISVGKGSPYDYFLGNPRSSKSYGCYSPVIVNCANKYFEDNNISGYNVYDITGANLEALIEEINEDNPVIVWASIDMREMYYSTTWNINGESITWKSPNHCLVLYGYDRDKNIVYISDPLKGNTTYNMDIFYSRYKENNSQAIVIK
jgi:uncharacterized protein YvpB